MKVQHPPVIERAPESRTYGAGELVRCKTVFSGSHPVTALITLNKTEIKPDHAKIRIVEFENYIMVSVVEVCSSTHRLVNELITGPTA